MSIVMKYKGYVARVDLEDDGDTFHGRVVNTRDVITFEGRSVAELRRAMRDSVETYLAFCAERHRVPDKPFSGRFVVRVDPSTHAALVLAAAAADQSLNDFVRERLRRAVAKAS
jgi:predicted HicB family RNase H-like nuclease